MQAGRRDSTSIRDAESSEFRRNHDAFVSPMTTMIDENDRDDERIDKVRSPLAFAIFVVIIISKSWQSYLLLAQVLGAAFICALSAVSIRRDDTLVFGENLISANPKETGGFIRQLFLSRKAIVLAVYLILLSYGFPAIHFLSGRRDTCIRNLSDTVDGAQDHPLRGLDRLLGQIPCYEQRREMCKNKHEELWQREMQAAIANRLEEERGRAERAQHDKALATLAAQKMVLKAAKERKKEEEQKRMAAAKERELTLAKQCAREEANRVAIEAKHRAEAEQHAIALAIKEAERKKDKKMARMAAVRKRQSERECSMKEAEERKAKEVANLEAAARKLEEKKECRRRNDEPKEAARKKAEDEEKMLAIEKKLEAAKIRAEAKEQQHKLETALKQAEAELAAEAEQRAQEMERREEAEKREDLARNQAKRHAEEEARILIRKAAAKAEAACMEDRRRLERQSKKHLWQKLRQFLSRIKSSLSRPRTMIARGRHSRVSEALEEIWHTEQHWV